MEVGAPGWREKWRREVGTEPGWRGQDGDGVARGPLTPHSADRCRREGRSLPPSRLRAVGYLGTVAF